MTTDFWRVPGVRSCCLRDSTPAGRLEELDLVDVAKVGAEVDAHAGAVLLIKNWIPGEACAFYQPRVGTNNVLSDGCRVPIGTHPLLRVRGDFAGAAWAGELAQLTELIQASFGQDGRYGSVEQRVSKTCGDEGEKGEGFEKIHSATKGQDLEIGSSEIEVQRFADK